MRKVFLIVLCVIMVFITFACEKNANDVELSDFISDSEESVETEASEKDSIELEEESDEMEEESDEMEMKRMDAFKLIVDQVIENGEVTLANDDINNPDKVMFYYWEMSPYCGIYYSPSEYDSEANYMGYIEYDIKRDAKNYDETLTDDQINVAVLYDGFNEHFRVFWTYGRSLINLNTGEIGYQTDAYAHCEINNIELASYKLHQEFEDISELEVSDQFYKLTGLDLKSLRALIIESTNEGILDFIDFAYNCGAHSNELGFENISN